MNMQDKLLMQALDIAGGTELTEPHSLIDRRISWLCISLLGRIREVTVGKQDEHSKAVLANYLTALHVATDDRAWSSPGMASAARELCAEHLDVLGLRLALQGHPADHREVQA